MTEQARPLVSLVMTAWNVTRWIGEAIRSTAGQTWRPLELIVWDDGSDDDTAAAAGEAMRPWRAERELSLIGPIHGPHQGRGKALRAALNAARGEFVGLLDADDRLRPECVERAAGALAAMPGLAAVYTDMAVIDDETGRVMREWHQPERPYGWHLAGFNSAHFMMWRREALAGWTPRHEVAVDLDIFIWLRGEGGIEFIPGALYEKRRRADSLSMTRRAEQGAAARAMKARMAK